MADTCLPKTSRKAAKTQHTVKTAAFLADPA